MIVLRECPDCRVMRQYQPLQRSGLIVALCCVTCGHTIELNVKRSRRRRR